MDAARTARSARPRPRCRRAGGSRSSCASSTMASGRTGSPSPVGRIFAPVSQAPTPAAASRTSRPPRPARPPEPMGGRKASSAPRRVDLPVPLRLGRDHDRNACLDEQPELGGELDVERTGRDELDDRSRLGRDRAERPATPGAGDVGHGRSVRGGSGTVKPPPGDRLRSAAECWLEPQGDDR